MVAVDVCASGLFQIVFFDVGENLLPASEILDQAEESFENSLRHNRKDQPPLRAAHPAHHQLQQQSRQAPHQEQNRRHRLALRPPVAPMTLTYHLSALT